MKNNKKELEAKMLNEEQVEAVRSMIIGSMRDVYVSAGSLPGDGFEEASGSVADKIIHNAQKALLQNNVFIKALKESYEEYPVKNVYDDKKKVIRKTIKKPIKKVAKKIIKKGKK